MSTDNLKQKVPNIVDYSSSSESEDSLCLTKVTQVSLPQMKQPTSLSKSRNTSFFQEAPSILDEETSESLVPTQSVLISHSNENLSTDFNLPEPSVKEKSMFAPRIFEANRLKRTAVLTSDVKHNSVDTGNSGTSQEKRIKQNNPSLEGLLTTNVHNNSDNDSESDSSDDLDNVSLVNSNIGSNDDSINSDNAIFTLQESIHLTESGFHAEVLKNYPIKENDLRGVSGILKRNKTEKITQPIPKYNFKTETSTTNLSSDLPLNSNIPRGREWKGLKQYKGDPNNIPIKETVSLMQLKDSEWYEKFRRGEGKLKRTTPSNTLAASFEPSRRQKQKHQINWLAADAARLEEEYQERDVRSRTHRYQAQQKYGW